MKEKNYKYILFLKYAIFEGEDRRMLFDRKFEEIKNCGNFFWGYGSYDITPSQLKPLIEKLKQQNEKIVAVFSQTKTTLKHDYPRGTQYSHDKKTWNMLPANITTHGKNLAFIFSDLDENDFDINLYDYKNLIGKQTGLRLPEYLIYPIHKAAAEKVENPNNLERVVKITHTAVLKDIVYIK